MSTLNRIANVGNRFQGQYKRVLCVCSAGLLRSPTAAVVLAQDPFNFNTRAVGISKEYALTPLETVHLYWADEVITFEQEHTDAVNNLLGHFLAEEARPIVIQLDIPDTFAYRHPVLIGLIESAYREKTQTS